MKSFIITLLILILVALYVARLSVTFKPFKVTFETPYAAFALVFLILSLFFLSYQSYLNGRKAAYEEVKIIINKIKEEQLLKEEPLLWKEQ